jgi:hypothetical protein
VIRNLIKSAEERVSEGKLAERAAELLAPVQGSWESPDVEAGGPAVVLFRAPEFLEQYVVPGQAAEKVVVESHFCLTPFLEAALAPQEFFVLGISRKHLRWFEYAFGQCRELDLPASVPPNLEAAGAFDQPDHDLENRVFVGGAAGTARSIRFGTLSDREAAGEYLHHFLGLVDRGLKDSLAGKPLVLAGVHEEIRAYRRAARYEHILDLEIDGNVEFQSVDEIGARARQASLAHYRAQGEKALADFREMKQRARVENDVRAVLRAAAQGRVHRLCVRANTQFVGPMERPLDRAFRKAEDLVNAAAAETLRTGGEVFILPEERLPATQPLAAILRY